MNAFLEAVKADLMNVRLRLAAILLAAALLAAVAYTVLGGGSSSTPAAVSPTPVSPAVGGIAITQAPSNPNEAVSETTNVLGKHGAGVLRDPFTPLPEATAASTSSPSSASSGSTGSTGSSGSSSASTPTTSSTSSPTPSSTKSSPSSGSPKPSTPAKPKTPPVVYSAAVLFGEVPPGTPPQNVQLTPYENLARLTPLPSSKLPLIVYQGVTAQGKSAKFTLAGEAILHGQATCVPSAAQCQAIELTPGQTEELAYVSPAGQSITYELQLVSITSTKASSARVARLLHRESKTGRVPLRHAHLMSLPGRPYTAAQGVLVRPGAASIAVGVAAGPSPH